MKIVINDYGGYPFIFSLSCLLAARGHDVTHCYSNDIVGGKSDFKTGGLKTLSVVAISIGHPVRKYQFIARLFDEIRYGLKVSALLRTAHPDVVINANMPLDAYRVVRIAEDDIGAQKFYWLQDVIDQAVVKLFQSKWYGVGDLIGARFERLQQKLLLGTDQIISICDEFLPYIVSKTGSHANISVIYNWAPLADIPLLSPQNAWRQENCGDKSFVFLYSGTLGLKHNPEALLALANKVDHEKLDAVVVVVSEGLGADWLREQVAKAQLESLIILPYQLYELLPQVLAAADVSITLLEKDAGIFSVPSKVMSYLCSGRAQLAAIPVKNLGKKLIDRIKAGTTVDPGNLEAFVAAGIELYRMPSRERRDMGMNGRRFAEDQFQIERIASEFELKFRG